MRRMKKLFLCVGINKVGSIPKVLVAHSVEEAEKVYCELWPILSDYPLLEMEETQEVKIEGHDIWIIKNPRGDSFCVSCSNEADGILVHKKTKKTYNFCSLCVVKDCYNKDLFEFIKKEE